MPLRLSSTLGLACLFPIVATSAALGCSSSGTPEAGPGSASESDASVLDDAGPDAASVDHRPPGVALCYTPPADQNPATLAFWKAFVADEPQSRAGVVGELQTAVTAYPEEEELALLLALANLWRVAEPLPSEAGDLVGLQQAALAAQSGLQKAIMLCPTDYRIDAWLSVLLVAEGRALGSQSTMDQGLQALATGIAHYPSFVDFSQALIYADRAPADPDFQKALQGAQASVDACAKPSASLDPACNDTPHAAHDVEGAAVFFGDLYAKAGMKSQALDYYDGAKSGPGWDSWAFQSLLEQRIATIDARIAAASADGGAASAVQNVWDSTVQCAICHER